MIVIDATKIARVKSAMDGRYERKVNKETIIDGSYLNDEDSYPTVLACLNKFGELVTSWSVEPSDSKYPSEKLVKTALDSKISKSSISGLVRNDGSIDTNVYLTQHQSLTNYIRKSDTVGLVKNDGTIDTNAYLTQHQSLTNYVQKSQTAGLIKNDGTIDEKIYLTAEDITLEDLGGVINVIEKQTANIGAFKTYQITQNNVPIGVDINIPKDFLVKSGSVKTVGSTPTATEADAELESGDKYISLIINTKDSNSSADNSELIIPAQDLVEDTQYTADEITITLLSNNEFKVKNGGISATQLAANAVETVKIKDGNVTTAKIADANVNAAKLSTDAVETSKIKDANVTTAKIADANVTEAKIATDAVVTAKIKDANVTYSKLSSTCIDNIKSDVDSEINAMLDALADAIQSDS